MRTLNQCWWKTEDDDNMAVREGKEEENEEQEVEGKKGAGKKSKKEAVSVREIKGRRTR